MPLNFDCQRFVHEWWATRQEIVLDLVGRMAVETLLAGSWFTLWYIAMISLMRGVNAGSVTFTRYFILFPVLMTTGTVVGSQVVDDWFYLRGRVSSLLCDNGGVQFVEAMKAGGGRDWDVDSGYLGLVEIWIHGGVSLCWVFMINDAMVYWRAARILGSVSSRRSKITRSLRYLGLSLLVVSIALPFWGRYVKIGNAPVDSLPFLSSFTSRLPRGRTLTMSSLLSSLAGLASNLVGAHIVALAVCKHALSTMRSSAVVWGFFGSILNGKLWVYLLESGVLYGALQMIRFAQAIDAEFKLPVPSNLLLRQLHTLVMTQGKSLNVLAAMHVCAIAIIVATGGSLEDSVRSTPSVDTATGSEAGHTSNWDK
ncbi:hypothetical protein BDV98DRAFT_574736 [Pterulicium gracile]|uniref:Uncharacterized protein n=1 Tax=Pterulicium gracile TaxID=1884261 RepID=A0A5C3Q899_9AGAR|nr:hypothetical protein BDV98DRAFT_574736 [Pterula gracilis]